MKRKSLAAELSVSLGFCSPASSARHAAFPPGSWGAGGGGDAAGFCAVRVSDTILLGAGFSAYCGGGSALEIIRH